MTAIAVAVLLFGNTIRALLHRTFYGSDSTKSVHIKARSKHPLYPTRLTLPDSLVHWEVNYPQYEKIRIEFEHEDVQKNMLETTGQSADLKIDKCDANELKSRISYANDENGEPLKDVTTFDRRGRPLNPKGRTGMGGRGLLGKWGPNYLANPIVTRHHSRDGTSILQFVAIQRKDTGEWEIPGGMVDTNEIVHTTLLREFMKEASESSVSDLFERGEFIYRGYVDDTQNTDHAWLEASVHHFHCDDELGERLQLFAGNDTMNLMWINIGDNDERYANLSASHKPWIDDITALMFART